MKNKRFAMRLTAATLCLCCLLGCASCTPSEEPEEKEFVMLTGDRSGDIQYLIMFFTNTSYIGAEAYLREFDDLYGPLDPESDRMVGFGLPGPMLINQSVEEIKEQVYGAFALAERYGRPVYFNLDDCTAYTGFFGSGSEIVFSQHPEMCEWVDFPKFGESWGGQSHGALPRWWFNWGNWMYVDAAPCLNSQSFLDFMREKIEKGFLPALTECYQKLIDEGKEYLFAGVSVGWETQIPDYTFNAAPGMYEWEQTQYGYHALYNMGYSEKSLKREADSLGLSVREHTQNLLMGVLNDFVTFMAQTVAQCGLIREKIFSHVVAIQSSGQVDRTTAWPDVDVAINEYCIPGWTMNRNTCNYDLEVLLDAIDEVLPGCAEFANTEGYSRGLNGKLYASYTDNAEYEQACRDYFEEMFRFTDGEGKVRGAARVVTVYGYDGESSAYGFTKSADYGFVKVTREWLAGQVVRDFDYTAFLEQMRQNMEEAAQ